MSQYPQAAVERIMAGIKRFGDACFGFGVDGRGTKEAGTQLDAIRAAVEELARDAERWRFVGGNDFGVLRLASHGEWVHVTETEIDAAIGRARNATKESGHE